MVSLWQPPPQGPKNDVGEALSSHSNPLLRLAKVTQKRGFSRRFSAVFRQFWPVVPRRFSNGSTPAFQRFSSGSTPAFQRFYQRFSSSSTPAFQPFSQRFSASFQPVFQRFSNGFPTVFQSVFQRFPTVFQRFPTVFQRFSASFPAVFQQFSSGFTSGLRQFSDSFPGVRWRRGPLDQLPQPAPASPLIRKNRRQFRTQFQAYKPSIWEEESFRRYMESRDLRTRVVPLEVRYG